MVLGGFRSFHVLVTTGRRHFHDLQFCIVLLLGDHKLSKIMSVVKGSLLTF